MVNNAISADMIPQLLNYEHTLIEKSEDIQCFSTYSLDIVRNFVAVALLSFDQIGLTHIFG